MSELALTQTSLCWFMTGLIWLIQLVHYPSFRFIDDSKFAAFHEFHSRRITWVVAPVMTVELLTAVALVFTAGGTLWILNAVGVVLIWISTALLSVPTHNRLSRSHTDALIARLIFTNWPRTVLWTIRSVALLYEASTIYGIGSVSRL